MPISSIGNKWGRPSPFVVCQGDWRRGVTLMELMVVLAIISLMIAIATPATLTGLENIRLSSGARSVAAFLNAAANRAERRQLPVELTVLIQENEIILRSPEAGFRKQLDLPQGITVEAVLPALVEPANERHFLFLPGGVPPGVTIRIVNHHGSSRLVHLDPVTGVARIEQPT